MNHRMDDTCMGIVVYLLIFGKSFFVKRLKLVVVGERLRLF